VVTSCKEIWREISNYIDGDISPETRELLEAHLAGCRHCSALLDSTRNILVLIADDRTFELPAGFGERLRKRLEAEFAVGR
jgi:anti-sigma factor (TIGR02949 family)